MPSSLSSHVVSVVYSSAATTPFTDAELSALLAVSRRNNARAGLTGLLLYRDSHFLQVLEGPTDRVHKLMDIIQSDSGHHTIRILLDELVQARQFPEWTMGFRTLTTAEDAQTPGYRSTFEDLADEEHDVSETTPAVRELIRWFQHTAR